MKPAKEHYRSAPQNFDQGFGPNVSKWIRGIQGDALRYAATISAKMVWKAEWLSLDDSPKRIAADMIEMPILREIEKLELFLLR